MTTIQLIQNRLTHHIHLGKTTESYPIRLSTLRLGRHYRCIVLLLAFLALPMAFAASGQTQAKDWNTIDIAPSSAPEQITAVKMLLPAADKTENIKVSESSSGKRRVFTFINNSPKKLLIWTYALERTGDGKIRINPAELATLNPGATTQAGGLYIKDDYGRLTGEYRIVYCATAFDSYYTRPEIHALSDDGRAVKAAVEAFEKRVKDSESRYTK